MYFLTSRQRIAAPVNFICLYLYYYNMYLVDKLTSPRHVCTKLSMCVYLYVCKVPLVCRRLGVSQYEPAGTAHAWTGLKSHSTLSKRHIENKIRFLSTRSTRGSNSPQALKKIAGTFPFRNSRKASVRFQCCATLFFTRNCVVETVQSRPRRGGAGGGAR